MNYYRSKPYQHLNEWLEVNVPPGYNSSFWSSGPAHTNTVCHEPAPTTELVLRKFIANLLL